MLYVSEILIFQKLDLSNRGLKSTHLRAFCNVYNIKTLDISRNNLTELPYLCTLFDSIRRFQASNNNIHVIPFGYFENSVEWNTLYLARNHLGMTPEPDFSPLANTLRGIRLSGNPWGRVPFSLYNTTYQTLWEVSMAGSRLREIPLEAHRSWPNIMIIRIHGNYIRCLGDLRNTVKTRNFRVMIFLLKTTHGIVVHAW